MNWSHYVLFSVLFFVIGQVFLKFDKNNAVIACCYFTISMGIVGLLTLLYLYQNEGAISISYYGLMAGVVFFFGNLLWIMSIKNAPSLSLIRVLMAGGETLLLLLAGYLVFKERGLSLSNIIGIILILSGVYFVKN
jgi:drug/metabolite transporter (DMT)-like permease